MTPPLKKITKMSLKCDFFYIFQTERGRPKYTPAMLCLDIVNFRISCTSAYLFEMKPLFKQKRDGSAVSSVLVDIL